MGINPPFFGQRGWSSQALSTCALDCCTLRSRTSRNLSVLDGLSCVSPPFGSIFTSHPVEQSDCAAQHRPEEITEEVPSQHQAQNAERSVAG